MATFIADAPAPELAFTGNMHGSAKAPQVPVPPSYVSVGGLKVHPVLKQLVEETICPGTGVSAEYFWSCLARLISELGPELEACLTHRDELQAKIDSFYAAKGKVNMAEPEQQAQQAAKSMEFLQDIGYLEADCGPVSVNTQFVDPEIAQIAAPQLVVPSDNARYVLNAVNARWGSLYDALYGFDVIPQYKVKSSSTSGDGYDGAAPSTGYDPVRGDAVIEFANGLLDEIAPLAMGAWREVVRLWPTCVGTSQQLEILLKSGARTSLRCPSLFVGSAGNLGPPACRNAELHSKTPTVPDKGRIFLKHNGLHLILEIDRSHAVGKRALNGIKDITVEAALTAILDMEDSVAAVDAEDKARVYTNICGVLRGTLEAPFVKAGKAMTRQMTGDIWLRDVRGNATSLCGRALCLIRNVGHHMFTDAVLTPEGGLIPEGFLDCMITVASSLHDLWGTGKLYNSRTGSVYIVKPKMHGPAEVMLTSRTFGRVEEFFGLRRNAIKMGIMDEERRTSVNLRECIRAASERVFFINTGFLDRTGDEIHTCMVAGPVVRKADIKQQAWIKSYEENNVNIGLFSGLQGKGQIGKGMWAKPDSMKAMLEAKISEVMAGASTAWVPSPSAAALHSIHYHRVDVPARQMQLAMRPSVPREKILEPPFLTEQLSQEAIMHELRENAQSILGYVVRWIDLGIGCSKVPDLSNVGLMEDRATLRISSQLLANWLLHGVVTELQVREVFQEMAKVVDQQNASEKAYRPMSNSLDTNIAFQAALRLVLEGTGAPNGYTEFTLHDARRRSKAASRQARL